jgi:hypothetical protein
MKKITEYFIQQIVDLKIDLHRLKNENYKLTNDLKASEKVNGSLRNEITTLRIILSPPDEV